MSKNTQEIFNLFKVMNNDVQLSINRLNRDSPSSEDFDFYARAYIRAYASWIEGSLSLYKDLIKNIDVNWCKELPLEYQLYLFEYDWSIKGSGEPYLTSKKIGTKDNISCFFRLISRLSSDFSVDKSKSSWSDVVFFYTVRDRMMHPKNCDSLIITKYELNQCERGRIWLNMVFQEIRNKILEKLG
jgi:hypothetical protein